MATTRERNNSCRCRLSIIHVIYFSLYVLFLLHSKPDFNFQETSFICKFLKQGMFWIATIVSKDRKRERLSFFWRIPINTSTAHFSEGNKQNNKLLSCNGRVLTKKKVYIENFMGIKFQLTGAEALFIERLIISKMHDYGLAIVNDM